MSRLEDLKRKIDALYLDKNSGRAHWADWLYDTHVFAVAEEAGILADRFGANKELAVAAGMLHDIADAVMAREDPNHDKTSANIAKQLLAETGFSKDEIHIIVDDALKLHGCHNKRFPKTIEGKVMATADAVLHLTTDFYQHCVSILKDELPVQEIKDWALPKLDRDFYDKIQFADVRDSVRPDYEKIKTYLSNL